MIDEALPGYTKRDVTLPVYNETTTINNSTHKYVKNILLLIISCIVITPFCYCIYRNFKN